MTCVAPTVATLLGLPVPAAATGSPLSEVTADLSACDRVAVLALDAFGRFAWDLWHQEMPYLEWLHSRRSLTLRSVLPSITPVNFATMVAGTDLLGHGINTFRDDFACETLFDVVRRAGGRSAGIGLEGYTGSELLGRCADLWGNAGEGTDDAVAEKVLEFAEGDRPDFLIAQLGRVDDVFHQYGPSSPEVVPMLQESDARVQRLAECLSALGYGTLILADHGQHDVPDPEPGGLRGSHGTDSAEDCLVPCTWTA